MSYRLFIDDQAGIPGMEAFRNPPEGETDWKVAKSSIEAINVVMAYGIPYYISFDHDLGMLEGKADTSMRFLKHLFGMHPEAIDQIEGWDVHSKNPSGSLDIQSYMDSWKRSRSLP